MNDICDWPGCKAPSEVFYSCVPGRRRELCLEHFAAFLDLKDRRGSEVAWRKLDSERVRRRIPVEEVEEPDEAIQRSV